MNRQYNGRPVELLAPVKTFADFQKIIYSKADAVYFGGKKFNMRVHNSAYNLSDDEIAEAVKIAHSLGKKVYVTFNNMMSDDEIEDAEAYLRMLEAAAPDALIIQDFGAVKFIKDLGLNLELHLSVMANVHNSQMVEEALDLGITRVVLSREMHLHEATRLVDRYPQMEFEYFTHGDMCSAHGAQCYISGVLFGNSGNRGRCMKPCRWAFQCGEETHHPLAAKDLALYGHLPQLISSGVNSFKIEGRMRDVDYLVSLINLYGEAIDRFLVDPTGYTLDEEAVATLQENRIRQISTGYAFKKPGAVNIDAGGREPRVFSQPVVEKTVDELAVGKAKAALATADNSAAGSKPQLAVTVNDLDQFKAAVLAGAQVLYLSGEVFRPAKAFTIDDMMAACQFAAGRPVRIYYAMPRMTNEMQLVALKTLVVKLKSFGITGLVCSNVGQIRAFGHLGLELIGDYGLNIYNQQAARFYESRGLSRVTLSIEAPAAITQRFLTGNPVATEVIVQGAPTMMYMEHDLALAAAGATTEDWLGDVEVAAVRDIVDAKGNVHPIRADQYGKNHLLPIKDFCYAPVLPQLIQLGVATVRIEGKDYTAQQLGAVVSIYRQLLETGQVDGVVAALEQATGQSQSLQSLNY